MKYIGYIVTKHYDKDTKPVDSPHRLFETIFLKPEYNIKIRNNRPDVLPIYTNEKEAIADSEWWPGHTNEDYGVVKKVTITIEATTIKEHFNASVCSPPVNRCPPALAVRSGGQPSQRSRTPQHHGLDRLRHQLQRLRPGRCHWQYAAE